MRALRLPVATGAVALPSVRKLRHYPGPNEILAPRRGGGTESAPMRLLRPSVRPLMLLASLGCALLARAEEAPLAARAEHVVLIVWDGMRPDFVRADTTPALHALAERGTFFANNHSVYITSTEVNGAALATGCYPAHTGIVANLEYLPDLNLVRPLATENLVTCRLGDILRAGRYLGVSTLAELVQRSGQRTVVAGTKGVALLHDRAFDRTAAPGSTILFAGKTYPPSALAPLTAKLGAFPEYPSAEILAPNAAQNAWTARAFTEGLWREGVPRFSTLWLGDPDYSQHLTQPGSATALAALRNCDTYVGMVIATLHAKGVLEKTDIFVVSDHGFSTVDHALDLAAILKKAGFGVVRSFPKTPRAGEILYVPLGGSAQFYVIGHEPAVVQKLAAFLQTTDFAGPIFTRDALPGTFALRDVRLDAPDSPDLLFSYRWTDGANASGAPGLVAADARKPGYGTHASLSRFDIHNTLLAAGPDIRPHFRDTLPTANVDVAPTIAQLLGLSGAEKMDGRVLSEALAAVDYDAPKPGTATLEATTGGWRQWLKITTLGQHTYLDEGNAGPSK